MKKAIAILAGEPNSIGSEIIFKTWLKSKCFRFDDLWKRCVAKTS